ncbi:phage head closure protein [Rhizobium sp. G21]|uniref:phage head closure protein n=1 Tax=Rhizobium sp. G21 TaxID=2758439 RepID=UPI0016005D29|nr:phage head closure protein [Rhizobium sp. G21]MBB1247454.1 phage head closure protein [Rhizobium sp. G21]
MSAGRMTERVAFDERGDAEDGHGGAVSAFAEVIAPVAAEFKHLRGGEAVQAARLAGQHVVVIRVRASSQTRLITTEWRARDVRTGVVYAIRDIEPEVNRAYISLTCQSGVAS